MRRATQDTDPVRGGPCSKLYRPAVEQPQKMKQPNGQEDDA